MPDTKGVSEHVAYEIDRLFATHGILVRGEIQLGALHDAVLESFALHLRNLIEFLFDKVKQPDNARAEHFFSDPARWRALVGDKPDDLDKAQIQAHKQISHLTYDRIGADKRWYVGDLAEKLHGFIRAFLDNADEERMGLPLLALKASMRR